MSVTHSLYGHYVAIRRAWIASRTPVPSAEPFDRNAIRRVLLVCTGLIGDTVMSLQAICAARDIFPDAELVALVTPTTRSLLAMGAKVDRFIVTEASPLSLGREARRTTAIVQELVESARFDLGVVFLGDDFAPVLTRARIPHRVFVAAPPFSRLATATYEIGAPRSWGPPERLAAWRALGLETPQPTVYLRPPEEAVAAAERVVLVAKGTPCVAIHPFGRTPDQRWPLAFVRELMCIAEGRLGLQVLVLGNDSVGAALGAADPRFRLVGRLTLEELVAVLNLCSCVVSTDSGPLHLAGTNGRPGVGLFRASRPEHAHRYKSISPVIAPDLESCRRRCTWDRCRWTPCRQMASIGPETVLLHVEAKLRGERPSDPSAAFRRRHQS